VWALGLGLLAGFVVLLLWLRSGGDPPAAASERPAAQPDAAPAAAVRPRPIEADADVVPEPEPTPEPEQRDHTGELLSAGPAQPISLPEPPEGAADNVPTPVESEAVLSGVIARLDDEIAAARAAGDEAEAARLEVRRARLERKLAERPAQPGQPDGR
jgi:hypothetical protein